MFLRQVDRRHFGRVRGVSMSKHYRIAAGGAALAMAATAAPAQATTTFAQFLQAVPNARIFVYTNVNSGGTKAKLSTIAASNTVLISDLGSLASPSVARINLVGTATALPTVGVDIGQLFSGTLTFTLLSPQLGLNGMSTKALKVTFANALLLAPPGGAAPTLQASSGSGSTISYESDFADLSGALTEDFALSFSGASTPLVMAGGRLPNFRVSGSGTFAAVLPVPEPASWALMMTGFGATGMALRRRRRMIPCFA